MKPKDGLVLDTKKKMMRMNRGKMGVLVGVIVEVGITIIFLYCCKN